MQPSGTAYREAIARTLYGTEEPWLNQLNRILRVVRTPQIGTKIDLKFLTESFRTALPPIAEDEINQLADGWEQLQKLRDERDEAEQALAAVTEFSRRSWRPWADAVIRAAADPVTAATSSLTQITRAEKEASDAVDGLTGEMSALEQDIAAAKAQRKTAEARREALRKTADYTNAVSAAANAEQLSRRATDAERQRPAPQTVRVKPRMPSVLLRRTRAHAAEDLESAERAVLATADNIDAQAVSAGLTELTVRHLPTRDIPRLRQGARLRACCRPGSRQADDCTHGGSDSAGDSDR